MTVFPSPIAVPLSLYGAEETAFRKLHRLVDVYETLIKYAAVIAIQNFYSAELDQVFPDKDEQFRSELDRPALGQWVGMLRESLKAFGERRELLFSEDLYKFYFRTRGPKPKTLRGLPRGPAQRAQRASSKQFTSLACGKVEGAHFNRITMNSRTLLSHFPPRTHPLTLVSDPDGRSTTPPCATGASWIR